jgi:arabinogalactan endo-1,4-beta-galactosidase
MFKNTVVGLIALFVMVFVLFMSSCSSFESSLNSSTPLHSPTQLLKAAYPRRIGVGATAYDWFAQKTWGATWDMINPIPFLAENGFNWLRVGVTTVTTPELESGPPYPKKWKNEYWCSREYALQVMRVGASEGMHLCLFFYLSDKGACAANQKAPVLWQNYSLEETASALKKHTFETTKYYKDKGLKIDLYEVGNEIEFGICGYSSDTKLYLPGIDILRDYTKVRQGIWTKEAVLLKSAIEGVKQADPEAKIILHISTAQYPKLTEAFFQAMNDFGVPYDFAGLSYYPWTNAHPEIPIPSNCLELAVNAIYKMGKEVIIAEVSFPSGKTPLIPAQKVPGYPFTFDGQAKWIRDFLMMVENNKHIRVVFYFYPDNYLVEDCGSGALFSDDKHPKPAIYEFKRFQSASIDTTPPVVKSVSTEPAVVKNGDVLEIRADCSEVGVYVTADISKLDSTKTASVVFTHDVGGIYKGNIQISPANEIENGIKIVSVNAIDSSGNIGTATVNVELKNFGSALDKGAPHDNFNGKMPDVAKWSIVTSGGGTVKQDGRLIMSTGKKDATSYARVQSVWDFTGDFDVQVDFQIGNGWSRPVKDHIDGATFGVNIAGQNYHITRLRRDDGADLLFAWNSGSTIDGQISIDVLSGKYRFVRVSTTLALLYDIGNGWQELANGTIPSGPAKVYLGNGSINASHAFTTYFDNFCINSGVTTYKP